MPDTPLWIISARSLIGTPFHWHSRTTHGLDCLGLVLYPLKIAKVIPQSFDFQNYGPRPLNLLTELQNTGAQWLEEIDIPKTGDIIAYPIGNIVSHLTWLDGDRIIHASQLDGVRSDLRADWAKREKGAKYFRVKENN